jgi:hypothetical protein
MGSKLLLRLKDAHVKKKGYRLSPSELEELSKYISSHWDLEEYKRDFVEPLWKKIL